jgi:nucleotide-binding universal stress UspA family protein
MFEKIVLATDLSPAWDELIDCATEFRHLGCTRIILTHVITTTFFTGLTESLRSEAQPALEQQKERLAAQGFEVSVEMPLGLPAQSLNDVACRHGADLIVVGSHGKSLWREGVLGSFSNAVVHQARYPVLVLKTTVDETKQRGTCRLEATELLRHILFPTDFSNTAARASEYLVALAKKGIGRVTLLNALELPGEDAFPPGYQEFTEKGARDLLEQEKQRLLNAGIAVVKERLDPGHPIPAILEILQTQDISLIIMGTQGKGFLKEIFLGSMAHNVARLAQCPVLLIPTSRE